MKNGYIRKGLGYCVPKNLESEGKKFNKSSLATGWDFKKFLGSMRDLPNVAPFMSHKESVWRTVWQEEWAMPFK